MLIIPFKDPSCWREQIQLTGILFYLQFTWNALNEFWVMDVLDGNEVPLVYGVKIVTDISLLEPYAVLGLPEGDIVCQNVVGTTDFIGRFDMSQKFLLVYYEPGEIDALKLTLENQNAV
jgi:hypothetical protein